MRQMHLAGFFAAGNVTHHHGAWRHPKTDNGFLSISWYQHIARTLERGRFDLLFLPDGLAIWDSYGNNLDAGLRFGGQGAAFLDPVPVLATMAAATERLGLGATISTTYYPPYHVARVFATLDHLTKGRAAWNVVTSLNNAEARNFGYEEHLDHDSRYDRADEFLEITDKLWRSWDQDALLLDKKQGLFADPRKVHYIDHSGTWFSVRGPLQVPRSPQGRPVIIQAGSSARGKTFAARWAEAVFTIAPNRVAMRAFYEDLKKQVIAAGRRPENCKILPAVIPILGDTEKEARERQEEVNQLVIPEAGLSTLSSHCGVDFSRYPLDAPIREVLDAVGEVGGTRGLLEMVVKLTETENLTLRDLGVRYGWVLVPQLVGTPEQVAGELESLFNEPAADGFVISPYYLPGAYEEFVDKVVPILQDRGLFRREYEGDTLRQHLGLEDVSEAEEAVQGVSE
uniref:Thermophilic dibenzothiophene desulfurization enzyme A n=1 Tax=Paenibacillus sp. A11-2 TaxID=107035 RepID=Q9LBX4_9BACL|nr:thermophilic dibenzothiophene desulfurization enzyme A [Paenibacillus sp. A11-2]